MRTRIRRNANGLNMRKREVSKKKIKIMFRMASYESGVGKNDLKIVKYYKSDYIRLNILKSIVCMTCAYVLCLGLIVLYNFEEIVKEAVTLPYCISFLLIPHIKLLH